MVFRFMTQVGCTLLGLCSWGTASTSHEAKRVDGGDDENCSLFDAGLVHGSHVHVSYAVGGITKCPFCDRCDLSEATVCMHVHESHREQVFAFEMNRKFERKSRQIEGKVAKIEMELFETKAALSETQAELLKTQTELLRVKEQLGEAERKVKKEVPKSVVKVLETLGLLDVSKKDENGDTILTSAAKKGQAAVVE